MSSTEWPGDARTIERWLRARMLADTASDEEVRLDGLDKVRITVNATGPNIDHLLIDATGVKLTLSASGTAHIPEEPAEPAEPVIVERTDGMLHSARIIADPVKMQGLPLRLDVTLDQMPFTWVTYDAEQTAGDPTSRFGIDETAGATATPSGSFTGSIRVDDISRLVTRLMKPLLEGTSVRVRRVDVTITDTGIGRLHVHAAATAWWKVLAARVRAEAVVDVTSDAVITIERLRLHARNPLIAIALRMVRSQITEIEGRTYDLNANLTGVSIHHLRVSAGEDLTISGRVS